MLDFSRGQGGTAGVCDERSGGEPWLWEPDGLLIG